MKKRGILKIVSAVMLSALLLTGCGSSKSTTAFDADGSARAVKTEPGAAYNADSAMYEEAAMGESDVSIGETTPKEESTGKIELSEEKIVYTANVSISTKKFEESVSASKALAKKYGAIIQSERYSDSDTSWYKYDYDYRRGSSRHYFVSLRIPCDNYEAFLNATGDIEGVIDEKSSSAENISQEYYDTAEVIASYEEELKRLKELMSEATEMSDILELEQRITEVQTSLNQQRSNLRRMDTDVAYSYVNLDIDEVAVYEKQQIKEETYAEKLASAFMESISEFRIVVGNILLWLVRHWALLLLTVVIVIIIIRIRKKGPRPPRMSRKEKKALKEAEKAAKNDADKMKFVSGGELKSDDKGDREL